MTRSDVPLQSLSIYLLKETKDPTKALIRPGSLRRLEIDEGHVVYIKRKAAQFPSWTEFFSGSVSPEEFGKTRSTGALLICSVENRHFAVTFGTGRYLLNPLAIEQRFGLFVTLNTVDPEKVRSIDTASLDRQGIQSRIQASRDASPADFGLDIERDLVRAVAGTPTDADVGETIAGYDSLHVNTRTTFVQLRRLLETYLARSKEKKYQKSFGWIDQIHEVRDSLLIEKLSKHLIGELKRGKSDCIWLAPDGIIDWNDVSRFQFGTSTSSPRYPSLTLDRFIDHLGGAPKITIDRLERTRVRALRADDSVAHEWPVVRCVQADFKYEGKSYLLNSGKWYQIDDHFVKVVNAIVASIPIASLGLPEYEDNSEGAYNERAVQASDGKLALMDAKNIQYGGGASKIEFCDLYSINGDMIHVKRYSGSSVLSHLFSQAVVSAQTFKSDTEFRELVNKKLPASHKLLDARKPPSVGAHRIVIAIVGGPDSAEDLPFFSRVTLKNSVKLLEGFGYKVALTFISLEEEFARLSSFREKQLRHRGAAQSKGKRVSPPPGSGQIRP
ncbi:MAG: TIGR04141 family sporadically distributed protein [Pseudomonadota bacterium]